METLTSTLVVVLSMVLTLTCASDTDGTLYQTFHGLHLQSPCLEWKSGVWSATACSLWCSKTSSCRAGSYNSRSKMCCLSDTFAYKGGVAYDEDEDSVYFQIPTDVVTFGDWTLVFRALGGLGVSFYDAWASVGYHDDGPLGNTGVKLGCVTLNGSRSCDRHFRSRLLDEWDSLGVQQVKLSLTLDGTDVLSLVFNGTESSVSSWCHVTRVLESPWTDLDENSTYNYFSVEGMPDHYRHFFINRNYGGCHNDNGWLCATDVVGSSRNLCPWENNNNKSLPVFLYSRNDTSVTWQENGARSPFVGVADVLAVFVKL